MNVTSVDQYDDEILEKMREITTKRHLRDENHNQQYICECSMEKCREMRILYRTHKLCGSKNMCSDKDKERSIWGDNYVNMQRINRLYPESLKSHIYVGIVIQTMQEFSSN